MSINKQHPTYLEFIKNEIKSLDFLKDQPYIDSNFYQLANKANILSSGFKRFRKPSQLNNVTFEFECELELMVEKKARRVFIGTIATPKFSLVSYMIAICESERDSNNLIRKFHFDYAIPNKNQEDKPIYHLQYGGEESPILRENSISAAHLFPKISVPRIFSTPVNLALILDMIFCEFVSEETSKIVARDEWRNFIKGNESFLLEPYYLRMKDFFIHKEHSSSRLLRDFQYGR